MFNPQWFVSINMSSCNAGPPLWAAHSTFWKQSRQQQFMRVRPCLVLKVTVTRPHLQENDAIIISKLMQNNKSRQVIDVTLYLYYITVSFNNQTKTQWFIHVHTCNQSITTSLTIIRSHCNCQIDQLMTKNDEV